jgi:hypothetical protein
MRTATSTPATPPDAIGVTFLYNEGRTKKLGEAPRTDTPQNV